MNVILYTHTHTHSLTLQKKKNIHDFLFWKKSMIEPELFCDTLSGYFDAPCSSTVLLQLWNTKEVENWGKIKEEDDTAKKENNHHHQQQQLIGEEEGVLNLSYGFSQQSWFPLDGKANQGLSCVIIPIFDHLTSVWSLAVIQLRFDPTGDNRVFLYHCVFEESVTKEETQKECVEAILISGLLSRKCNLEQLELNYCKDTKMKNSINNYESSSLSSLLLLSNNNDQGNVNISFIATTMACRKICAANRKLGVWGEEQYPALSYLGSCFENFKKEYAKIKQELIQLFQLNKSCREILYRDQPLPNNLGLRSTMSSEEIFKRVGKMINSRGAAVHPFICNHLLYKWSRISGCVNCFYITSRHRLRSLCRRRVIKNRLIIYGNETNGEGYVCILRFLEKWFLIGVYGNGVLPAELLIELKRDLCGEVDSHSFFFRFTYQPDNPARASWTLCMLICWWCGVEGGPPSVIELKQLIKFSCERESEQRAFSQLNNYALSVACWTFLSVERSELSVYLHSSMVNDDTFPEIHSMQKLVLPDKEFAHQFKFLMSRHADYFAEWLNTNQVKQQQQEYCLKKNKNGIEHNYLFFEYLRETYEQVFQHIQLLPCRLPPKLIQNKKLRLDLVYLPLSNSIDLKNAFVICFSMKQILKTNCELYTVTYDGPEPNTVTTNTGIDAVLSLISKDVLELYQLLGSEKKKKEQSLSSSSVKNEKEEEEQQQQLSSSSPPPPLFRRNLLYDCIMVDPKRIGSHALDSCRLYRTGIATGKELAWTNITVPSQVWLTRLWRPKYMCNSLFEWLKNCKEMINHFNQITTYPELIYPGSNQTVDLFCRLLNVPNRLIEDDITHGDGIDDEGSTSVLHDSCGVLHYPYPFIRQQLEKPFNSYQQLRFQFYPIKIWMYDTDIQQRSSYMSFPLNYLHTAVSNIIKVPDQTALDAVYGNHENANLLYRLLCMSEARLCIDRLKYDCIDNCVSLDLVEVDFIIFELFTLFLIKINTIIDTVKNKGLHNVDLMTVRLELEKLLINRSNDVSVNATTHQLDIAVCNKIWKSLCMMGI